MGVIVKANGGVISSTRVQCVSRGSETHSRMRRIVEGTNRDREGIGGKTEPGRGMKSPLSQV